MFSKQQKGVTEAISNRDCYGNSPGFWKSRILHFDVNVVILLSLVTLTIKNSPVIITTFLSVIHMAKDVLSEWHR